MKNLTNKLIEKYNLPDSVLVISSYPEKGIKYSGKVCAVGGFTKNTLLSLSKLNKENPKKLIVLTVSTDGDQIYEEDGMLIVRIFERHNPLSFIKLFKAVRKFNKVKKVLLEFEFGSFGDVTTTGLFPLFVAFLKAFDIKTTVVLHQVLSDLSGLSGHLGWSKNNIKSLMYNFFLRRFLYSLVTASEKTVVLEEYLRLQLIKLTGQSKKIITIPHGVDSDLTIIEKSKAKKLIGVKENEKVILYFGFINWYKGTDFLIKSFIEKNKNSNYKLIIAGGESTTQNHKEHYQEYMQKIYSLVKNTNIQITGFVKEGDIAKYFSAADIVVFPYRVFMSSSGPLSLAYTFKKPFILSKNLVPYLQSEDFKTALEENNLEEKDLVFDLNSTALMNKIKNILSSKKINSLINFSSQMASSRSFDNLALSYSKLFENEAPSLKFAPALQNITGYIKQLKPSFIKA